MSLWVRADLETFNPETLALIPEEQHAEYAEVIANLGQAATNLMIAHEQFAEAQQRRKDFFDKLIV